MVYYALKTFFKGGDVDYNKKTEKLKVKLNNMVAYFKKIKYADDNVSNSNLRKKYNEGMKNLGKLGDDVKSIQNNFRQNVNGIQPRPLVLNKLNNRNKNYINKNGVIKSLPPIAHMQRIITKLKAAAKNSKQKLDFRSALDRAGFTKGTPLRKNLESAFNKGNNSFSNIIIENNKRQGVIKKLNSIKGLNKKLNGLRKKLSNAQASQPNGVTVGNNQPLSNAQATEKLINVVTVTGYPVNNVVSNALVNEQEKAKAQELTNAQKRNNTITNIIRELHISNLTQYNYTTRLYTSQKVRELLQNYNNNELKHINISDLLSKFHELAKAQANARQGEHIKTKNPFYNPPQNSANARQGEHIKTKNPFYNPPQNSANAQKQANVNAEKAKVRDILNEFLKKNKLSNNNKLKIKNIGIKHGSNSNIQDFLNRIKKKYPNAKVNANAKQAAAPAIRRFFWSAKAQPKQNQQTFYKNPIFNPLNFVPGSVQNLKDTGKASSAQEQASAQKQANAKVNANAKQATAPAILNSLNGEAPGLIRAQLLPPLIEEQKQLRKRLMALMKRTDLNFNKNGGMEKFRKYAKEHPFNTKFGEELGELNNRRKKAKKRNTRKK